ncbi:1298_t:CDS:2, partial [Ambispora leptoticha]
SSSTVLLKQCYCWKLPEIHWKTTGSKINMDWGLWKEFPLLKVKF